MGGRRTACLGVGSTTLELSGFVGKLGYFYFEVYVLPKEAVLKFLVRPYGLSM